MKITVFTYIRRALEVRSARGESERLQSGGEAQHVIWRRIPVKVKSLQKPCIFV